MAFNPKARIANISGRIRLLIMVRSSVGGGEARSATEASGPSHKPVIVLSDAPITDGHEPAMDWDEQRLGLHLKLRDLNVLMTVARCGSMGKAAAQLSVSQPAISKAIAEMEYTLGVPLLDRSPRGVEP